MNRSPRRVFISYSHETPEQKSWALALADRLRSDAIDARIDRYVTAPEQGWPLWMQHQIEEADFVILVCTAKYKLRFEGRDPEHASGVTWEGLLANQILYDNAGRNRGFIPVLPPNGSVANIPLALRRFTYYEIYDQYEALYWHIQLQPVVVPLPLPGLVDATSSTLPRSESKVTPQAKSHETALKPNPVKSEGFPPSLPTLQRKTESGPHGDTCFSMELLSPLNCQVFQSGVICTKYGPESSVWTVHAIADQTLFSKEGQAWELEPFLVLIESRTKEAVSIVANTRLWLLNPVASGASVQAGERIGTILLPKDNTAHPPFTVSRGMTYDGILHYRPRLDARYWRMIGSEHEGDCYRISDHHVEQNSGVIHIGAPVAGIFEPSSDFHGTPGGTVQRNDSLGFILRKNIRHEIRATQSGLLLSTMVRVNEAVHAGQHLFRVRINAPRLHVTVIPFHADRPYWYELFAPINGTFRNPTSTQPGFKFERGAALCEIDAGNVVLAIGLDVDGSVMQLSPHEGTDVHFGQLLMMVRAERVFIRSPIVGNFHCASLYGGVPFVKEGDVIEAGQVLCSVEALKLENEIESDVPGIVSAILVQNGQPVEYGEALFIIQRTGD